MLNKSNQRELSYIVRIDNITPIEGYDRVELAHVGGWTIVVGKGEFHAGDPAIYFEIDSKLPEVEPFTNMEFLAKKKFKIKTQKMCGVYSQGLLMSAANFDWTAHRNAGVFRNEGGSDNVEVPGMTDDSGIIHYVDDESRFLTKQLGVTYSVVEDRKRKNRGPNKYQIMSQRRPDIFKRRWARWMMRREWGKKVMFFFFGKKKDNDRSFPTKFEYVKKTDQERVENMPWVLNTDDKFIRTQKCDGSSATYILERKKRNKFEFYVCSRNVRMFDEKSDNFYSGITGDNPYWEMAKKYNIKTKLEHLLREHPEWDYICWQGEICGPKIQKNPHKLKEYHLFLFHMITSDIGKWDIMDAAKQFWEPMGMEHVPIEDQFVSLENNMEDFKLTAEGYYSPIICEGNKECPREGYVYYKVDDPNFSFKNVSRSYLLKRGE